MTGASNPRGRHLAVCCFAAAVGTAFMVGLILSLNGAHFDVPLNYLKDANIFLVRAKSIVEGNWVWRNPRLGIPFGANWIDFPMNITIDSAMMWILSRFTSSMPIIANLDWLIGLSASAGLAAYAFVLLGFGRALAVSCAVIFTLQPYAWLGLKTLHCSAGAVPLVAAAAILLVTGRLSDIRRVPALVWIGCVIVGLSYAYIAFFSCLVLVCAATIAWLARRDRMALAVGLSLTGSVVVAAVADLTPSLLYWYTNGPNASMLFKSPAEAEVYGLKIRYLLTPSPDHPLRFLRAIEQRLASTKFPPIENENEYARLGTVGSVGFLCLLGLLIGKAIGTRRMEPVSPSVLGACAALTLVCILFASTGGLNTFFDTFVFPDIRAWARIFPFIGYFCVAAVAAIVTPSLKGWTARIRIPILIIATVLAVFDQAVPSTAYDHSDALYRQDELYVKHIETLLPAGSAIFELPYIDFPNDTHPGNLVVNDMLRPYLHSARYRWSAGAVSGMTSAQWNQLVAAMPVPEMLNALVHQAISGLWVDLAAYGADRSPESALTHEIGSEPVWDSGRRFLFYDLRSYAARVRSAEEGMELPALRSRNPVQALFERGFYFAEIGSSGPFRWSLARSRITLVNPLPIKRRASIRMRIATLDGRSREVRISGPNGSDWVPESGVYERQLDLPEQGRYTLNLSCDCTGAWNLNRTLYFYVSDFGVRE